MSDEVVEDYPNDLWTQLLHNEKTAGASDIRIRKRLQSKIARHIQQPCRCRLEKETSLDLLPVILESIVIEVWFCRRHIFLTESAIRLNP